MRLFTYTVMVIFLAASASATFTAFPEDPISSTKTLKQNYGLNLAYSSGSNYRVSLSSSSGEDLDIKGLPDQVVLGNSNSQKTVLMPSGATLSVKTVNFTALISRDSLRRNHSFSIDVMVEPGVNVNGTADVVLQRTLEYGVYTRSDQIKENKIESNSYKGQILEFDKGKLVENKSISETKVRIDEGPENESNNLKNEKASEESGNMTFILAGLIFVTVLFIIYEVVL